MEGGSDSVLTVVSVKWLSLDKFFSMRFSDVIGLENIKSELAGIADSGRIPHAMLFTEDAGSGALPLLLSFIQYISCKNRADGDSCGKCPSCSKISKMVHPDLHFVFPVFTTKSNKKPSEAQAKALKLINKGYRITADKTFFEKDDSREACNWDSVVALFRRYGIEYIPEGLVKSL